MFKPVLMLCPVFLAMLRLQNGLSMLKILRFIELEITQNHASINVDFLRCKCCVPVWV